MSKCMGKPTDMKLQHSAGLLWQGICSMLAQPGHWLPKLTEQPWQGLHTGSRPQPHIAFQRLTYIVLSSQRCARQESTASREGIC